MSKQFAQFTGDIPENYHRGLGPHLFMDYGRDIARRAAALQPRRLLELAAGTGIVTQLLRDALADTQITATDLNPAMLDVARRNLGDAANIRWQPADAMALPFDDNVFDAVVCQFGVMFFPDKDLAYREVYRTLAPGGRYLFNAWDSFEHNPFARVAHETISGFFSAEPPGFYHVPFSYHRVDEIAASLAAAAFTDVAMEVVTIDKEISRIDDFSRGLVYGNPVIDEIRNRADVAPDVVMAAISAALHREFGAERRMSLQAIVASAAKPA
ncbi:MAG: type 11 methyltransferase [Gammaproteobacteria bacterium]|nr:MAG: type 11 methyltransferase [Gammaproteobacteria bacterium]TND06458.1 MAG: type 11 methyltransferase [Gammaproteobacteria bacterium]